MEIVTNIIEVIKHGDVMRISESAEYKKRKIEKREKKRTNELTSPSRRYLGVGYILY